MTSRRADRSGFACFVGRPNAGKSTLTNAIVGTKVAITANQPQTTRRAIRGIVHRDDAQLVLVDTPGLHRPRTLLGQRLNDVVRETLAEVDVIGFCLPANEKTGPGDQWIARELASLRAPVVAIVTKTDLVTRAALVERLVAVDQLGEWAEIVPVSAATGEQVDVLADVIVGRLPEGPPMYPAGDLTDEPQAVMIAELVREAALEGVRDELPHSLAVMVEEVNERESVSGATAGRRRVRHDLRRAGLPEGHRHRPRRRPPQGRRHARPPGHRGAARAPGLPRPPREGREGLAARPQAAGASRVLAAAYPARI